MTDQKNVLAHLKIVSPHRYFIDFNIGNIKATFVSYLNKYRNKFSV